MTLNKLREGNSPPRSKDPRPVYVDDINKIITELNVGLAARDTEIASKVTSVEGKDLSTNDYTDEDKALTGAAAIVESANLTPTKAYAEVTYDTNQTLTITAVSTDIDGEDIQVAFVDPEDVSQSLAVSYDAETNIVTISHATNETGVITTAAGSLVTAINEDEVVGLIIQSAMGNAGIIDYTGTVQLDNYEYGRICKVGEIFSDGTNLYIALTATDGVTNETTDFRKIVLASIS